VKSLFLSTALALSSPALAQECVDVELALLADLSSSMDTAERKVVRQGHVDAFRSGAVLDQIFSSSNPCGAIYVTYIEWSIRQNIVVDWTLIDSDEAAEDFAAVLEAAPFSSDIGTRTFLGPAMEFAAEQILGNGVEGQSRVIDILADGRDDGPLPIAKVIEKYSGPDIPIWERISFNGLPVVRSPDGIDSDGLVEYFQKHVIGGPGAIVIPAKGFEDVPEAIIRKLRKEIG
jgi:hypothetical protein